MDKVDFDFDDVNCDFNLPDGDCKYFSMSLISLNDKNIMRQLLYILT